MTALRRRIQWWRHRDQREQGSGELGGGKLLIVPPVTAEHDGNRAEVIRLPAAPPRIEAHAGGFARAREAGSRAGTAAASPGGWKSDRQIVR